VKPDREVLYAPASASGAFSHALIRLEIKITRALRLRDTLELIHVGQVITN